MKNIILVAITIALVLAIIVILQPSDSLGISVSQLGNGIKLENLGTADCVVFVRYPGGADERIVLGAGQTELLLNRPQPVEISAVAK